MWHNYIVHVQVSERLLEYVHNESMAILQTP